MKIVVNILKILNPDRAVDAMAGIAQHQAKLLDTGKFKRVQVDSLREGSSHVSIALFSEKWDEYENNERPKMREHFKTTLVDTDLAEVIGTLVYDDV